MKIRIKRKMCTAEIKIKKDEMILISIRFLGITMAKALDNIQQK
jgi:hypothetical protein